MTSKRNFFRIFLLAYLFIVLSCLLPIALFCYRSEGPQNIVPVGLVCVLFAAFVAAAIAAKILSGKILEPIEILKRGVKRFAHGDFKQKIYLSGPQEMKELSEAINEMAAQLNARLNTVVLQHNEQNAILSSMAEGIIAIDNDERIMNINETAAKMFGVSVQEVKNRWFQESIRNSDLYKFVTKIENGSRFEDEIRFTSLNKQDQIIQLQGTVIHNAENKKIGTLVVLNDVTRLKHLQNIRKDFVANVSHELRTPLTSIKGFVETLQDGAMKNPEEAERFIGIVANQVNRLNSIIADLLTLSKIEEDSEKKDIIISKSILRPVLKESIEVCMQRARQKNIRLDLDCEDGISAKINTMLLEQALINLIDNAIKYSEPETSVLIRGYRKNEHICIDVTDQGSGIDKKHFPRLFERFYRIDKARSRKMGGTGLGLSIVKHIMETHNGSVSVESESGQGSTFILSLPLP